MRVPVGRPGLAQEIRVHAGHDAQERALAGAVRAEHADLGAGEEREPDALQDLPLGRDDLAKILHREDVLVRHRDLDYTGEVVFMIDKAPASSL